MDLRATPAVGPQGIRRWLFGPSAGAPQALEATVPTCPPSFRPQDVFFESTTSRCKSAITSPDPTTNRRTSYSKFGDKKHNSTIKSDQIGRRTQIASSSSSTCTTKGSADGGAGLGDDDAGVTTVLSVDFVAEPSVGGVGVGIGPGISFRMRSRWLTYHALTLSSIVARFQDGNIPRGDGYPRGFTRHGAGMGMKWRVSVSLAGRGWG